MFTFGLIGCGTISKAHGNALAELDNAKLVTCYDIIPEKSQAFAEKYGVSVAESFESMLESDIDAVCICLPSGIHVPYAIQALKAGKNVVVEKPLGITPEQLDEIEKVSKESDKQVGVISQLYFSDGFSKSLEAVQSGKLGKLILGEVSMKYYRTEEYFKAGGWRGTWNMDGGGALMNQGIHGVQLLLHLFGPVRSVKAYAHTIMHDIQVEDTAVVTIEFKNGALGNIVASTATAPGFERNINIHAENGSIMLTNEEIIAWDVPGDEKIQLNGTNGDTGTASDHKAFGHSLHARQIGQFVEACKKGEKPALSIAEGRKPVELILAIYESSRTGKTIYFD